jgi:DUF1016 N-terminal domain
MAKKRYRTTLPHDAERPLAMTRSSPGSLSCSTEHATRPHRPLTPSLRPLYWEVVRRVVELEQRGQVRAAYGEGLWKRLADDLTARHGRGFSKSNIALMRAFYLQWNIFQTPSGKLTAQAKSSPFSELPGHSEKERPDTRGRDDARGHLGGRRRGQERELGHWREGPNRH